MIDLVLTMFFLEESLDEAKDMPPLGKRVGTLFTWIWQFTSSRRPTYLRRNRNLKSTEQHQYGAISQNGDGATEDDDSDDSVGSAPTLFSSPKNDHSRLKMSEVLNRDTILLLITFLIFQLANISFNSLYPIFAQAQPPTGRDLNPEEIGFSLAFAGVITILFQIGIFGRLREKGICAIAGEWNRNPKGSRTICSTSGQWAGNTFGTGKNGYYGVGLSGAL